MSDQDRRPGLESDHLPTGRYSVVATMADMEAARLLVEELEQHGVPPGAIALTGAVAPEEDDSHDEMPEGEAISDVTRSTVGGGVVGSIVGGVVGALFTLFVPDLSLSWAIFLGVIFGGGIGLGAGGMAVAKYNSPAWRESYESVQDDDTVSVGVHVPEREMAESAEELMRRHEPLEVRRLDDREG